MKTYHERTNSILEKVTEKKKKQRKLYTIGAGISTCAIALGLFLFVPFNTTPPSVTRYHSSDYYPIIEKLNEATFDKPEYKNIYELLQNGIDETFIFGLSGGSKDTAQNSDAEISFEEIEIEMEAPTYSSSESGMENGSTDSSYQETTDNQVAGVIEGDRIKRSNDYIYYMNGTRLSVYSIDGENSKQLAAYTIEDKDGYKLCAYEDEWEMFLSEDCSTITVISTCYAPNINRTYVCLISLDVTDPENIKENQRSYVSGSYLSSRLVNGEILLISHYNVGNYMNFSDESTFIPQYGTPEEMVCIPADNIIVPDKLNNTRYTVVCKLNEKTLDIKSSAAFLSYADEVYVSKDHVFATRAYYTIETKDGFTHNTCLTEISALSYSGDALTQVGSITIEGSVNNQYNLDEYEGILRVVTTTNKAIYREYIEGAVYSNDPFPEGAGTNASLYCIDLSTWQVVASVEHFAPFGESVQSVRFDKDKAYVCTAIVLSDPVFVFDLSDLNNITYKDTGTITGYSISLINFGEDHLLGIGYGDSFDTLKLEIYQETASGVASVCSYEVDNCYFATDYKAYYINRDKHLVGIGYDTYNGTRYFNHYALFLFDGYDFVKILDETITGSNNCKRAVLIDEYLYMFGENFIVKKL